MITIDITNMTMLTAFWLCFTRWVTILFQLPIFDNSSVPAIVKILASFMITFAFFPFLKGPILHDIQLAGADCFWTLTMFHSTVGLIIGFIVKNIMSIFLGAGSIMTQQVGFAAMRYFDPNFSQASGPFEMLLQWTILILILTAGALFPMIKGCFDSFFSITLFDFSNLLISPEFMLKFLKDIFLASLLLASPLIFSNLVVMAVLGIIARTVPQMNVLMISFVVNIGLGLFVFAMSSSEMFQVGIEQYTKRLGDWFQLIN